MGAADPSESMRELIQLAGRREDCSLLPPAGQPVLADGRRIPDDLRAFYDQCGGLLFDWNIPIAVVGPARVVPANPIILEDEAADDISAWWHIVAESDEGSAAERVTIDLHPDRLGRCYNSFWDRHAMPGSSAIVAATFTELLERLIAFEGEDGELFPFWLADDFEPIGDAYD
jgi:hypothetical protein